jgi:hypothetical protein
MIQAAFKSLAFAAIIVASGISAEAQVSLRFKNAMMVTDQTQTVPANHVWKVTSIYGSEFRENECVNFTANSSHELRTVRCACQVWSGSNPNTISVRLFYQISGFMVNNIPINTSISGLSSGNRTVWNSTNCSGNTTGCGTWDCANISSDPNILPIWIPAGTTLRTAGPNTFLSVIEFEMVP